MAVRPATLARPAPLAGRRSTLRGVLEREGVFSWLMLGPGVLFLLAFVAYPFFYGIFLSLEERRGGRPRGLVGRGDLAPRPPHPGFLRGSPDPLFLPALAPGFRAPRGARDGPGPDQPLLRN